VRGLDAVVLTGGIVSTAGVCKRVCRDAAWLGVGLDQRASKADVPRLSTAPSRVAAPVIRPTRSS
jgi:acetate kinase